MPVTWTIRLLVPRHLAGTISRYRAALRDELVTPLRRTALDELQ